MFRRLFAFVFVAIAASFAQSNQPPAGKASPSAQASGSLPSSVQPATIPDPDWSISGAHVTLVEAQHVPVAVWFSIDVPAGSCTAGTELVFAREFTSADLGIQRDAVKAIYS